MQDVNEVDELGCSALHYAVGIRDKNYRNEIVEALLTHGAKVDPINNRGETPYDLVDKRSRLTVQMLEKGMHGATEQEVPLMLDKESAIKIFGRGIYELIALKESLPDGVVDIFPLTTLQVMIIYKECGLNLQERWFQIEHSSHDGYPFEQLKQDVIEVSQSLQFQLLLKSKSYHHYLLSNWLEDRSENEIISAVFDCEKMIPQYMKCHVEDIAHWVGEVVIYTMMNTYENEHLNIPPLCLKKYPVETKEYYQTGRHSIYCSGLLYRCELETQGRVANMIRSSFGQVDSNTSQLIGKDRYFISSKGKIDGSMVVKHKRQVFDCKSSIKLCPVRNDKVGLDPFERSIDLELAKKIVKLSNKVSLYYDYPSYVIEWISLDDQIKIVSCSPLEFDTNLEKGQPNYIRQFGDEHILEKGEAVIVGSGQILEINDANECLLSSNITEAMMRYVTDLTEYEQGQVKCIVVEKPVRMLSDEYSFFYRLNLPVIQVYDIRTIQEAINHPEHLMFIDVQNASFFLGELSNYIVKNGWVKNKERNVVSSYMKEAIKRKIEKNWEQAREDKLSYLLGKKTVTHESKRLGRFKNGANHFRKRKENKLHKKMIPKSTLISRLVNSLKRNQSVNDIVQFMNMMQEKYEGLISLTESDSSLTKEEKLYQDVVEAGDALKSIFTEINKNPEDDYTLKLNYVVRRFELALLGLDNASGYRLVSLSEVLNEFFEYKKQVKLVSWRLKELRDISVEEVFLSDVQTKDCAEMFLFGILCYNEEAQRAWEMFVLIVSVADEGGKSFARFKKIISSMYQYGILEFWLNHLFVVSMPTNFVVLDAVKSSNLSILSNYFHDYDRCQKTFHQVDKANRVCENWENKLGDLGNLLSFESLFEELNTVFVPIIVDLSQSVFEPSISHLEKKALFVIQERMIGLFELMLKCVHVSFVNSGETEHINNYASILGKYIQAAYQLIIVMKRQLPSEKIPNIYGLSINDYMRDLINIVSDGVGESNNKNIKELLSPNLNVYPGAMMLGGELPLNEVRKQPLAYRPSLDDVFSLTHLNYKMISSSASKILYDDEHGLPYEFTPLVRSLEALSKKGFDIELTGCLVEFPYIDLYCTLGVKGETGACGLVKFTANRQVNLKTVKTKVYLYAEHDFSTWIHLIEDVRLFSATAGLKVTKHPFVPNYHLKSLNDIIEVSMAWEFNIINTKETHDIVKTIEVILQSQILKSRQVTLPSTPVSYPENFFSNGLTGGVPFFRHYVDSKREEEALELLISYYLRVVDVIQDDYAFEKRIVQSNPFFFRHTLIFIADCYQSKDSKIHKMAHHLVHTIFLDKQHLLALSTIEFKLDFPNFIELISMYLLQMDVKLYRLLMDVSKSALKNSSDKHPELLRDHLIQSVLSEADNKVGLIKELLNANPLLFKQAKELIVVSQLVPPIELPFELQAEMMKRVEGYSSPTESMIIGQMISNILVQHVERVSKDLFSVLLEQLIQTGYYQGAFEVAQACLSLKRFDFVTTIIALLNCVNERSSPSPVSSSDNPLTYIKTLESKLKNARR